MRIAKRSIYKIASLFLIAGALYQIPLDPNYYITNGKERINIYYNSRGAICGGCVALPTHVEELIKNKYKVYYLSRKEARNVKNIDIGVNIEDPALLKKTFFRISHTGENFIPKLDDPELDLVVGFSKINSQHPKYIRNFTYYYTLLYANQGRIIGHSDKGECNPNKKYFACFLVSHGMKEDRDLGRGTFDGSIARIDIFHRLSLYKFVASGNYLRNVSKPVHVYDLYKDCKFVISYENQTGDGYITEKLPQAYAYGAVPIYYGTSDVKTEFNPKAFIYAKDFKSPDNLVEYIKKVDKDDSLYCKIWNEKLLINQPYYDAQFKHFSEKAYNAFEEKRRRKSIN